MGASARVVVLVCFLAIFVNQAVGKKPFAQGNIAIVINATHGIVSPSHHLQAQFTSDGSAIWCQASSNGLDVIPIAKAEFKRAYAPFKFDGELNPKNTRAYLRFGTPNIHDPGKYKCEIHTEDGEFVWGNLFVYMRPVFLSNGSVRLEQAEGDNPFSVTASSIRFNEGDAAILHCPVIAYPQADVEWTKDGKELDWSSDRLAQRNPDLYIKKVTHADEGVYRCRATNTFPLNGNDFTATSVLDMQLRINNHFGWLLPLIIIIVILLLLFIIIYACTVCKRRRQNQYNVAKREANLRNVEAHNLRDNDDDDD